MITLAIQIGITIILNIPNFLRKKQNINNQHLNCKSILPVKKRAVQTGTKLPQGRNVIRLMLQKCAKRALSRRRRSIKVTCFSWSFSRENRVARRCKAGRGKFAIY